MFIKLLLTLYIVAVGNICFHVHSQACSDGQREKKAGLCDAWSENGYCENNKEAMKVFCRRTCKFCAYWSEWSVWGGCSVSCDTGVQTRSRICISSNPNKVELCKTFHGEEKAFQTEAKTCKNGPCPECKDVEQEVGCMAWKAIGYCEQHPSEMKKWCAKSCNFCFERIPGTWDEWSSWDACSATCNGGTRSRTRVCISPNPDTLAECVTVDGSKEIFEMQESLCNRQACKQKCLVEDRSPICGSWREAGYCTVNKTQMNYWCAKTCFC